MASMMNMVAASFSNGSSAMGGRKKKPCNRILCPASVRLNQRQRSFIAVRADPTNPINQEVRKTEEKVVDYVFVGELSNLSTAYCRCWRSASFPLCDGSHVKHNKATGDNVGPLVLKKRK